jgi:hypothetical protein
MPHLPAGSEKSFEKPVYVTRLKSIYGESSEAIAKIVGYPFGHLGDGWDLLYLIDTFTVDEYEMRGAAWFSDGVPSGHKLSKDVNRSAAGGFAEVLRLDRQGHSAL